MGSKALFDEMLSDTVILINEKDHRKAKGKLNQLRVLLPLVEEENRYEVYQRCRRRFYLANYHYALLIKNEHS